MKSETGPYTEGRERLIKETRHSRLVGGRFNKHAYYIQGLSSAAACLQHMQSRSLHVHPRI